MTVLFAISSLARFVDTVVDTGVALRVDTLWLHGFLFIFLTLIGQTKGLYEVKFR
jgi:hypothetical protein